jgi:hypothetical protein
MADKSINQLPVSSGLTDDGLLAVYQNGEAQSIKGELIKQFAKDGVDVYVAAAENAAARAEEVANSVQDVADDVAKAKEAAEAAEASRVAAEAAKESAERTVANAEAELQGYVTAAEAAKSGAEVAAANAAQSVENTLRGYVTEAEEARDDAQSAAEEAARGVETALQGYVSDAQAAKEAAESAAETAATEAVQNAETKLAGYVSDAEQANTAAQSAAEVAAQGAVAEVETELAGYVSAAEAAKTAAEKARDDAQSIAGGDFASTAYVDGKASTAESNAKNYTDQKIAAIPTPDVSGQIGTHNTDTGAHADIRKEISDHAGSKSNPHGVTAAQVGAPTVAEMNAAIAAIPTPDVSGQINTHNESGEAHADIRFELNSEKESKPFGYITEYTTVLAEGSYGVYSQNMYGTFTLAVSAPSLVAGETYIVTLNGEKTTWVAYSSGENVCIGTGDPVTNKPTDSIYIVSVASGTMMIYLKTRGTYTIAVDGMTSKTVEMPIDLLPDSAATKDYVDTAIGNALPAVTISDNGKFLRVVDGAWAASTVRNAEEVEF